jgi:polyhydroxyalkanoate synthesis regulator phasin
MQQDAWRTYLELALGLTEKPRKRAKQAIDTLAAQSGASVDQLRSMTEELVETSVANREAVAKLVRSELDKALRAVGLVNADRLTEMQSRIDELEHRLAETEAGGSAATRSAGAAAKPTATKPAAKKTAAKKTAAAKKTTAKKAAANKATAKKAGAKKAAAGTTAAKKAPATSAATKTAAATATKAAGAKKTGAKKAGTKKTAAARAPESAPRTGE